MKKAILLLSLLAALGLGSCSSEGDLPSATSPGSQADSTQSEGDSPVVPAGEAKAMVVYFSATGTTERAANYIADYISAPIHELEPVDPYTDEDLDYGNPNSRTSLERANRYSSENVVELVETDFAEFDESNYIFIGAPVWHGNLSWVINDFVLSNDFSGKTIIPFATASSSGIDASRLEFLSPEATWLEGIRFRNSEVNQERIESWVDSLGIDF